MARKTVKELAEEMAGRVIASGTVKERKLQKDLEEVRSTIEALEERNRVLKAKNLKLNQEATNVRKFRAAMRYVIKFVLEAHP